MQKRAAEWMAAIKNAHASYYSRFSGQNQSGKKRSRSWSTDKKEFSSEIANGDSFMELRQRWPEAIELLDEDDGWINKQLDSDFFRTKENEYAYYGALAVRRIAKAAEASLSVTLTNKDNKPCVRRDHIEDEELRNRISREVAKVNDPIQLKDHPNWREQDVLRLLKKVQDRRVENRTSSISGCARCDGSRNDEEAKLGRTADAIRKKRKIDEAQQKVAGSRLVQSTGLASKKERG